MARIAIYQDGKLMIPGKRGVEEVTSVHTEKDFIIVLPRKYFLIDKVTLPEIALEDSEDTAIYQAIRMFGREDLKAYLLPIEKKNSEIECLLIAIDLEKISEIEAICKEQNIPAIGISMATLIIADKRGIDGLIIMDWGDHIEALVKEKNRIKELYMIPKKEDDFIKFLEDIFSGNITEIRLADLTGDFNNTNILFKINASIKKTNKNILIKILISIILCILIAISLLLHRLNSLENKKLSELKLQFTQMKNMERKLLSLQKEYETIREKRQRLEKIVSGIEPIHLLAKLSKILPKGTIISSYRVKSDRVTITGYTPSVSKLIENLGRAPFVKDLKILSSSTRRINIEGKEVEKFSVSFSIEN